MRRRRPEPRKRAAPQQTREWWNVANGLLWHRAQGRCEHCGLTIGARDPVERHHRIRRRDGGDRLSNLLLLRKACHEWITHHPEEARRKGWIVSALGGTDPTAAPVLHWGRRWVTLTDEGTTLHAQAPAERDTPGDVGPGPTEVR